MKRTYEKGRSTEGWVKGEPVTAVSQVKPGTVLIGVSHQFEAENLYIVVEGDATPHNGQGFYVKYVLPDLTPHHSDGHVLQWVWDFMLAKPVLTKPWLSGVEADKPVHERGPKEWFLAEKLPCTLPVEPTPMKVTLTDQSEALYEGGNRTVEVAIEKFADGSIGLKIPGYGTSDMADGYGSPIILELWEGRLRLIAWRDINREDPDIIDMEGARESARAPEGET